MNISADGILGTAQKINQKRISAKNRDQQASSREKTDTLQIGTKLSGRLNNLQGDLRATQESLSRNQVIGDGLSRLQADMGSGGSNARQIIEEVRYNNAPVLADFLQDQELTEDYISSRIEENRRLINEDISSLSRLQVESENIFASNLVPDTADLSQNIAEGSRTPESISNVQADVVMRLTK